MRPSTRERRQRRHRVIAALLAFSLAAPPLLFAVNELKDFGAGLILLALVAIGLAAYLLAGRRPSDEEG